MPIAIGEVNRDTSAAAAVILMEGVIRMVEAVSMNAGKVSEAVQAVEASIPAIATKHK